jgi:exopolyphosphatase
LAKGYQIVGEFLDLNHAHINYTESSCRRLRQEILNWKTDFTLFQQEHPEIPVYLASPLKDGRVHHAKESRFFWLNTPQEHLPKGSSPVTPYMQRLAIHQAKVALGYLNHTMTFQRIMASHSPEEQLERQETFHNLRKTLRAMCDELDVMGAGIFLTDPSSPSLDAEWALLVKARSVLGDLNDLWTAYDFYVQHDKLYLEQDRLVLSVDSAFLGFKQWAHDEDLAGALHYMIQVMGDVSSNSVHHSGYQRRPKSLSKFLKIARKYPTHSIVIGNEAGDADTVISAISLAYIETYAPQPMSLRRKTPIVSIPKRDLEQLRPEINLLLQLAGLSNPAKELLFVDSSVFRKDMQDARVTLVDHNAIEEKFEERNWHVTEILDHHEDRGIYIDATPRTVAYLNGKVLVASACTLVAERMMQLWEPPYPASISLLLMGVILLDSVNLSPEAGKVTQRDIDAIHSLLEHADWQQLSKPSQWAIGISDNSVTNNVPDTDVLFHVLQDAKYDPTFWASMSVHDALRYDFKDFEYRDGIFGISAVLMPLDDFVHKTKLVSSIKRYMKELNTGLLAIMFTYQEGDHIRRQLMICTDSKGLVDTAQLEEELMSSPLELQELSGALAPPDFGAVGLEAHFFNQENAAASRKQIGPMLQEFLDRIISR